jgi:BirA family biotin operon repressor/biotin-[acetyl-CoA-carboxylase] ligase
MSLLFRPTFLDPTQAQQLTMLCSLAAADTVTDVTGLQPDLKWPNDLLLNGKKLAGVLTELGFQGGRLDWVVVGVGLNVNIDFATQSDRSLSNTATSLMMALGRTVSRLDLLQHYLVGVEARYEALRAGSSPHREWARRLVTLGQSVTVTAPNDTYQGIAESVDETGTLLLRQSNGQLKRILAGDVTLQHAET